MNRLPVTSPFSYTYLLFLHKCPPARLHQFPPTHLVFTLCSYELYALWAMPVLCVMPLHALHYAIVRPFKLLFSSRPSHNVADERINISSLLWLFLSRWVLCLIIMETLHLFWRLCSVHWSPVGIMLRFISLSSYQKSLSYMSFIASQLWIIWLLSPFLHMTTTGDHTPRLNDHLSAYKFNSHDSISWNRRLSKLQHFSLWNVWVWNLSKLLKQNSRIDLRIYIYFTEMDQL